MSFSFGKKDTKQTATQQNDPYAPTVPLLNNYLANVNNLIPGSGAVTDKQTGAINTLEANAGNPFADQIGGVAQKAFDINSEAPTVTDAYKTLQSNIGGYASGQYTDVQNNPQIQALLKVIGDDTSSRINQTFAGAGRDLSGLNQQAVARGVSQGEAQPLLDLFTQEQDKQLSAANSLYGAGDTTGKDVQGLNTSAVSANAAGAPLSEAYTTARDQGANDTINYEQLLKTLPTDLLSKLQGLITPVAGLGGTSTGTQTGSTTSMGASVSGKDIASILAGLAAL